MDHSGSVLSSDALIESAKSGYHVSLWQPITPLQQEAKSREWEDDHKESEESVDHSGSETGKSHEVGN